MMSKHYLLLHPFVASHGESLTCATAPKPFASPIGRTEPAVQAEAQLPTRLVILSSSS